MHRVYYNYILNKNKYKICIVKSLKNYNNLTKIEDIARNKDKKQESLITNPESDGMMGTN